MFSEKRCGDVFARLRDGLAQVRNRGDSVNEADTRALLITPVLEALDYTADRRRSEHEERGSRPDEICYAHQVTDERAYAAIILEAKRRGADFDRPERSGSRPSSPDRQLQRYLKQHGAGGPDTIGILTDGVRWRVYRRRDRGDEQPDTEFVAEYDFAPAAISGAAEFADLPPDDRAMIAEFVEIARIGFLDGRPRAPEAWLADVLFDAMLEDDAPASVVARLVGAGRAASLFDFDAPRVYTDLGANAELSGVYLDAYEEDWESHAYTFGPALPVGGQTRLLNAPAGVSNDRAVAAAVKYRDSADGVGRHDAAICARALASASRAGASVILAYCNLPDGTAEARLAAFAEGRVNMTVAFNPEMPPASARLAVEGALRVLGGLEGGITTESLLAPLEAAPLRQRFYREVAGWVWRLQRGQSLARRQAVLRHLIRVMFSWILKEEDMLPPELFESAFAAANMGETEDYHRDTLRFLFQNRLNTPAERRTAHPNPALESAMERAPFLNGSLFTERNGDEAFSVPRDLYWSANEDGAGLFTIFSRYHWTVDEHRPNESEQTLDPELLSNIFEQLITPTETGEKPPERQPRGTYYTPADVVFEMVKDALSAAVASHAPPRMDESALLDLFGGRLARPPDLSESERTKLVERIRGIRVFDPAVGSGAFLFGALTAIKTALENLSAGDGAELTTDIIRRQLYGQDISPLATQITRLRLFIAIKASDGDGAPLPNLEARVVCADTLENVASADWRPEFAGGRLDTAIPGVAAALTALAQNMSSWFDAHLESDKAALRERDALLRGDFRALLESAPDLASDELMRFADMAPFTTQPRPALTDSRLLFYENPWRGFDVVIGNPPYEALRKSVTREGRGRLVDAKRYRTTNVGDLYALFCEAALALANPEGGVVTMITPLSVAFGQRQRSLRNIFESRCRAISLRHYDNRPDTMFNASPTVRSPSNSQRATVATAILGDAANPAIKSTGLQRWPSEEREFCLPQRSSVELPSMTSIEDRRLASQWPRVPTRETADLLLAVSNQKTKVADYATTEDGGAALAFPMTAGYFVGIIPAGTASPRRETLFRVADMDAMRLLTAALNGHVAYGWWRMFGDGFDVNLYEFTQFTIPDAWVENPDAAIALGQRLLDAMPECLVEMRRVGRIWANVNFHRKPDLIEELDRLHLEALGLPAEPLLTHLRIMRSNNSWDYSGTSG